MLLRAGQVGLNTLTLRNDSQGYPGFRQHDAEEAVAADSGNRSARALRKLKMLSLSRCESPRIPAGHDSMGMLHFTSRLAACDCNRAPLLLQIDGSFCKRLLS